MASKQWTRNYDNLFAYVYGVDREASVTPMFRRMEGDYVKGFVGTSSTTTSPKANACHSLSMPYTWSYLSSATSKDSSVYTYIQLGSGNTPVSYDGYALGSPITSNMKLTTANTEHSYEYDEATQTYTQKVKMLISYSGTETITVGEFGVFLCYPVNTSSNYPVLVYHETLDAPVTLNAGDTIDIRFTRSIVQPSHIMSPN